MTFTEQITSFVTKADSVTTNVYRGSCKQISLDIAEESPVSTGRLLGSWSPSNGTSSSHFFSGGRSAWVKKGNRWQKETSIAEQNKAMALTNLIPRIDSEINSLTKLNDYYFTNDTDYIANAEYEGWEHTGAYHMIENAVLNWQLIVNTIARVQ